MVTLQEPPLREDEAPEQSAPPETLVAAPRPVVARLGYETAPMNASPGYLLTYLPGAFVTALAGYFVAILSAHEAAP